MKHPCKPDCPRRTAECRKTCAEWIEFEKWKFSDYERRLKQGELTEALIEREKKRGHRYGGTK